jgi:DNA-binding transcriptional ArsR family regulator
MAGNEKSSATTEMLLALRHPLRRQILQGLKGDRARSPRELADRFGLPLSNVSYHVRVLADCGAVKLVRTRRVRGATQHFYRSSIKSGWALTVLKSSTEKQRRRRGDKKGP